MAYAWHSIVGANKELIEVLSKEMTRDQLAEAQKLAAEIYERIKAKKAK